MAKIKNPVSAGGNQTLNSTLTMAVTTSSPAEIKAFINAVIADMPELQYGKFFALRRSDWSSGTNERMAMFNISDGTVCTDSAVRISMTGNLSARSFSTTSALYVNAGDTFEFIKVTDE